MRMPPKVPAPKPSALRLLILAPTTSSSSKPPFPSLLEALTLSKPAEDVLSFAGYTSHPPLQLRTKYYSSDVSIWCDELPASSNSSQNKTPSTATSTAEGLENLLDDEVNTLEGWKDQMLSPAAAEVRAVIGGIVLVLPVGPSQSSETATSHIQMIETAHALREAIEDEGAGRDIASIVVLQPASAVAKDTKLETVLEKLEEDCISDRGIFGWDFVCWDGEVKALTDDPGPAGQRNQYGEQVGIKRVTEALQGVDWSLSPHLDDGDGEDLDFGLDVDNDTIPSMTADTRNSRFDDLDGELQREMMELKLSLDHNEGDDGVGAPPPRLPNSSSEDDEDFKIEQLPGLMEQVIAIREAGSEMSRFEREKFAKREIQRIMKEMG